MGAITSPSAHAPGERDLRIAVSPLVDAREAGRRGDLGLGCFLNDEQRVWLEPAAVDQRGERRAGETVSVGRVEASANGPPAGAEPSLVASARQMRVIPPARTP